MAHCYRLLFLLCFLSTVASAQTAVCLAYVNVALPADACTITLRPEWIDGGSYAGPSVTLVFRLSDHEDLGPGTHTVTLHVDAFNANTYLGTNACWSTVTVEDEVSPELTCHDQTVYLVDPAQPYTLAAEDYFTASDNCGIDETIVSVTDGPPAFGASPFSVIVTDHSANSASCSGTVTTVDAEPQNYCTPSRNPYFEHIRRVRLTAASNTIDEASGNDGGYRHHLPTGANVLYHGYGYTLNYEPGFRGSSSYHEYWSVYLDKNGDGDFTDAGELLHQWNGYGNNGFTFSVPGSYWGWSRLRVVMRYGGYGNPCGSGYGETEDISVYLRPRFIIIWPWPAAAQDIVAVPTNEVEATAVPDRPSQAAHPGETTARLRLAPFTTSTTQPTVFPNPAPAGTELTVRGLAATTGASLELRDMSGRVVARQAVNGPVARMTIPAGLPAGVYLVSQVGTEWRERVVIR